MTLRFHVEPGDGAVAFVGMDDAARQLGLSRRTLTDLIKRHPYYSRGGRQNIFYPEDIQKLRECTAHDRVRLQIEHNQRFLDLALKIGPVVYFITTRAEHVKIGFAKNLLYRMRALQQGCTDQLLICGITPGTMDKERELHKRFERWRYRSEWYFLSDEIKQYIKEHCIS